MKVLVLGSGLLGVTTAYVLASRGHTVEVFDRQPESGTECSYANGGQLSYSAAEPWATPHVLTKLPKWLTHPDSPLVFRLRADPDMIRWGLKFLRNCTTPRAERNCINLLRLGLYSRLKMQEIIDTTGIAFDYIQNGILQIFDSQRELNHAAKQAEFQAKFGCEQHVLTGQEVLTLEPALSYTRRTIAGGIHAIMDGTGDAFLFCRELAAYCTEKLGVVFHYDTAITQIDAESGRIYSVTSEKGEHTADAYVMALGAFSTTFLKGLGLRVPIYPMKGYSLTVEANEDAPRMSITDGQHKIVFSPLGDRVRVAGTAEFAGYNQDILEARIRPIMEASRSLLPTLDWDNYFDEWACLRPQTPGGPPILGATPMPNLFLNTGHGTLGWTQAAGSAYIVADVMEKRLPEITLGGLSMGNG